MYIFQNGTLLKLDNILDEVAQDLKSKVISYMLENHNIEFLDDELEKELYNIIFDVLGQVFTIE